MTVSTKWCTQFSRMNYMQLNELAFQKRISRSAAWFGGMLQQIIGELLEHTNVQTDNHFNKKQFDEAYEDLRLAFCVKEEVLKTVETKGFSSSGYLKAKSIATLNALDSNQRQKRRRRRDELAADIQHPELYRILHGWRSRTAKELDIEPANIMQQRALINVSNNLPGDKVALRATPFVGKITVEKYGDELLQMVNDYAARHQLECTFVEKKKKSVGDSAQISFNMFNGGKTIEQIAKERQLAVSTVTDHLSTYVKRGHLPLTAVMTRQQEDAIREAIQRVGSSNGLSPILADCAVAVNYAQVRLVLEMTKDK